MWWKLRLCFFLNRHQITWSKYPLTRISKRDKRLVSDDDDHQLVMNDDDCQVPDFTTLCTSSRFFCSAPGSSSSIIEIKELIKPSLSLSSSSSSVVVNMIKDSIAVETYSSDPYMDFKRSMLEIVEASSSMKKETTAARWSFLHEMLLCFLELNHKSTHKVIIHAFADLLLNHVVLDALDNKEGK